MLENYSGATRIFPIIGSPIAQVRSPAQLTRAFDAAGYDAVVVPFHIEPRDVGAFLNAMDLAQNVDGILATIPHKFAAHDHATTKSQRCELLGSANIMRRTADGGWYADMLDGVAMVRAIEETGMSLDGCRALLIGGGGAGSAIGLEVLNAGAGELAVHDVSDDRLRDLLGKLNRAHPGKAVAGTADPAGFDLIINATPAGMREGDPLPVETGKLTPEMFVADVITVPEVTPMLEAARAKGCRTRTGTEMHNTSLQMMVDFLVNPASSSL